MMNDKNWLIRTANFQILGPVTKQKIIEVMKKGALAEEDELSQGNGFWFYVKEKELINKYIYGSEKQDWSILSEAKDVLTAPLDANNEDEREEQVTEHTAVTSIANLKKEAMALPSNEDLEYPVMTSNAPTAVAAPDIVELAAPRKTAPIAPKVLPQDYKLDAKVKLPTANDLDYPDLPNTASALAASKATPPKKPAETEIKRPLAKIEVKYQRKTAPIKLVSNQKNDSYLFFILLLVAILGAGLFYYYKKILRNSVPTTSFIGWVIPAAYADINEHDISADSLIDNLEGNKKVFLFPTSVVLENVRINPIRSIFGFEIDVELPSTSCSNQSELWSLKTKVLVLNVGQNIAELKRLQQTCPLVQNYFKVKKNELDNDHLIKNDFLNLINNKENGLNSLSLAKSLLDRFEKKFSPEKSSHPNTIFLYTLRAVIFSRMNNQVAATRNLAELLKSGPYQIYFNSFLGGNRADWFAIFFAGLQYLKENFVGQDLLLLYGEYLKNIVSGPHEVKVLDEVFIDLSYKKMDQILNSTHPFKQFPSAWYFVLYQKKFRERANQLMVEWSSQMSNTKAREQVLWTLPYWSANNSEALLLGWISGYKKMPVSERFLALELAAVLPYKTIFEKIVPEFKKAHFQVAREFYRQSSSDSKANFFFLYKLFSLGDKDISYLDNLYSRYEK